MTRHPVLILSPDPLAAALLGAAVDLARQDPQFPIDGESARAALLRLRPRLVLVDCDDEDACAESFLGPALMTGARLLLFRSRRSRRDVRPLVERMRLVLLEMPVRHEELERTITELVDRRD